MAKLLLFPSVPTGAMLQSEGVDTIEIQYPTSFAAWRNIDRGPGSLLTPGQSLEIIPVGTRFGGIRLDALGNSVNSNFIKLSLLNSDDIVRAVIFVLKCGNALFSKDCVIDIVNLDANDVSGLKIQSDEDASIEILTYVAQSASEYRVNALDQNGANQVYNTG